MYMYMPQKTEWQYSYVLYKISCEHEGVQRHLGDTPKN